jgi:hypothetical protein
MFLKFVIILLLLIVLASLFSGLVFMNRDAGSPRGSTRTAKALTVRIAVSLLLFGLLMLGFHLGWFGRS